MNDPAGGQYLYTYNATGTLASVAYPDGKTRQYLYENPAYPTALTGITDENGDRHLTVGYDSAGRAISAEHAGGADKVTVQYKYATEPRQTLISDSLGTTRAYNFKTINGTFRNVKIDIPCDGCGGAQTIYDSNNQLWGQYDFNGNQRRLIEDPRGLLTYDGDGIRLTQTTWHTSYRLPTRIWTGNGTGITTTFTYDTTGNLTQKTVSPSVQGYASADATWTYTYNANGQVLSVDGPRTDVTDQTSYDYDASGNLTKVTNALGHITQLTNYDAHGRVGRIIDANGLVTDLTYDPRGQLTSRKTGTETTTYAYDGAGNLIRVTLPNGAFLAYSYDAAHRLTGIQDTLGNRIVYTLDALGNRTKEDIYDPANTLTQTHARVYNTLNRLQNDIGAANQTTAYTYDNNGNRTGITDPLGQVTSNAYDAINRLIRVTDPANGVTAYGYDPVDQLASVTDPRNLTTRYDLDYNQSARPTQTVSPDAGVSNVTYDLARNVISRQDAKGQTTNYQYDALNRLTKETRADGSTVTYSYDAGTNQKGRLTGMTDASGSTTWQYDLLGRVIQQSRMIGGTTRTTKYSYDAKGQLASVTYPSGQVINYSWTNGQITAVKLGTTNLATNIVYRPFGPVKAWTFGNGQAIAHSFDLDGRMTQNSLGTIVYDDAGRITGAYGKTYGYDSLDRLTRYNDGTTLHTYSYDPTGNRTQQVVGSTTNNYAIDPNSNKIQSISAGTITKPYTHDANGSVTSDGTYTQTYDTAGRLIQVSQGTTVKGTYTVNGLGQRVKKVAGTATTLFAYDEAGHLLGEYSGTALIQETVWLGDLPLATFMPSGKSTVTYYIHTDHLNTPRRLTDSRKTIVWSWEPASFGATSPNEDPDRDRKLVKYNLRMSWQIFDTETGLLYNTNRFYDAQLGRYLQFDPLGLAAGINPFAYVYNNPLSFIDPLGLFGEWPDPSGPPAPPTEGDGAEKTSCFLQCVGSELGLTTLGGAAAVGASLPVLDKPFNTIGASTGTSLASSGLSKVFPGKSPVRLPAPTLKNPMATTKVIGRAAGRWVPIVGWCALAYDAIKVTNCTLICESAK